MGKHSQRRTPGAGDDRPRRLKPDSRRVPAERRRTPGEHATAEAMHGDCRVVPALGPVVAPPRFARVRARAAARRARPAPLAREEDRARRARRRLSSCCSRVPSACTPTRSTSSARCSRPSSSKAEARQRADQGQADGAVQHPDPRRGLPTGRHRVPYRLDDGRARRPQGRRRSGCSRFRATRASRFPATARTRSTTRTSTAVPKGAIAAAEKLTGPQDQPLPRGELRGLRQGGRRAGRRVGQRARTPSTTPRPTTPRATRRATSTRATSCSTARTR